MTLRPDKTVQKILISSTSRFVGEYEKGDLLITHAWSDFADRLFSIRISEGPASRSAYVFAFKTTPVERKQGTQLSEYSPMGDLICSYLSVLYGKRFDSHGLLEGSGFFHVPELSQYTHLCEYHLPQNSHNPRVDFKVPLSLTEFSRIDGLFLNKGLDKKFLRTFEGGIEVLSPSPPKR